MTSMSTPLFQITEARTGRSGGGRFRPLFNVYDPDCLAHLRSWDRLDEVVAGVSSDLDRVVRLRSWVRQQWAFSISDPCPPPDGFITLEWVRKGKTGGFCGNFSIVFLLCSAALGFRGRLVSLDKQRAPDGSSRGGHCVCEVWVADLGQWVLMDTSSDIHYTRNGRPLCALDLHRAWVHRDTGPITAVEGAPLERRCCQEYFEDKLLPYYYSFRIDVGNPVFEGQPGWLGGYYTLEFADDQTEPTPGSVTSTDPDDFYPVFDEVEVEPRPSESALVLRTYSPHFSHFLVREAGRTWRELAGARRDDSVVEAVLPLGATGLAADVEAQVVTNSGQCGRPARVLVAFRKEALPPKLEARFGRPGRVKNWSWSNRALPETLDGEFRYPAAVAIGPDDLVYVTDRQNHRIQVFSQDGRFVRKFGSEGDGPGQLRHPQGLAIAPDGRVYVADMLNGRIQVFDLTGRWLAQISRPGPGPGEFLDVHSVALDAQGVLYASDSAGEAGHEVLRFDSKGRFLGGKPEITPGRQMHVQRFDPDGRFLGGWGAAGEAPGLFRMATGIAVGPNQAVYVVDCGNCRVQQFDREGRFLSEWGSPGREPGQFRYPSGIAVDADGVVYVADSRNHRVQKFDAAGNYLASWSLDPDGEAMENYNKLSLQWEVKPGELEPGGGTVENYNPRAIAVATGGRIFVVDADNHCVLRFQSV